MLGHGAEEARKACRVVGWGRLGKGREDREAGACENDVICISLPTTHPHTQQVADLKTVRRLEAGLAGVERGADV